MRLRANEDRGQMRVMRTVRRIATSLCASWAIAATAEPSFVPVYADNFPDPFIVQHQGEFIAYSTNYGLNLPMLT